MASTVTETIQSVQYVKNCHVVEENGQIAQVFVEAELPEGDEDERTRTIKSVVRSIIGAVALNHDLQLDYRKIKVVEYKPAEESGLVIHPRIQIGAAFLRRFPRRETVVELHVLGRTAVGTWPSTDNPAQDAYYACVNALAGLGYTGFELVYLEILHNDFANEKIVLLKVKYATVPGGEETLLGVAEIQEDLPLAVVKAVLNAINRRIGLPTRT
ncbi:MAG TPA: hypothetical protein GX008_11840 [Firmicutes bacterium]|jgi:hypothetical protein|nr:MAG: hypothetical protein AA931_07625 [Peptococcaceae bacterium 1109]HHT74390.1 hypothetical protein [Bacillota bacterium]